MSEDWDVIEEMEFWDDYKEIYGEDPLSGKQKKQIKKVSKQNAKNQSTGCCAGTMLVIMVVMIAIPCLIVGLLL